MGGGGGGGGGGALFIVQTTHFKMFPIDLIDSCYEKK